MTTRVVALVGRPEITVSITRALGRARDVRLCGTGTDIREALKLIREHRPHVLILGLQSPDADALKFLDRLMRHHPMPVVALADGDERGGRTALRSLELGALEALDAWGLRGGSEGQTALLDAVRVAAQARETPAFRNRVEVSHRRRVNALRNIHQSVVALGASTGGTEALHRILPSLPEVTPGIVVTLHMPAGFTAAFASHLNRECQMEVREARDGDRIRSGLILIAPGDRHLRLRRGRDGLEAALDAGAPVNRHRPSVDVLFRSVAEHCGADAVGVILTGMGEDGAAGLRAMRERGATTMAQDQATSVVYGMPRAAVSAGGAELVLPLDKIPPALLLAVLRRSESRPVAVRPS